MRPGDTVWLRGGTYAPPRFEIWLNGNAQQPIVFRSYPGERVTIDCGASFSHCVTIVGQHVWLWGVEVKMTPIHRTIQGTGTGHGVHILDVPGAGVGFRLINSVIHDADQGVGLWTSAQNAEVYGSLIYYNGHDWGGRGHGHGIYTQNLTGVKRISDNIIWGNYSHGLHAYTENGSLDNIVMEGNISFENGSVSGFGRARNLLYGGKNQGGATNCTVIDNYTYYGASLPDGGNDVGYTKGCTNVDVSRNRFYTPTGTALSLDNEMFNLTLLDNLFWGVTIQRDPSNTVDLPFTQLDYPNNTFFAGRPAQNEIFVRPNQYEAGRANIAVYNWEMRSSVQVDLSGVLAPGASFEIRDAQDFYGAPVLSGVYSGGMVTLPMTSTAIAMPIGTLPVIPAHTGPEFGAFIVLPAISQTGLTMSSVQPSSITASSATINWTTNQASDTQVEYGTSMSLGQVTPLGAGAVTTHSVALTGLTGGTTYFYRARSRNAAGNLAVSPTYSFATSGGGDTTAPVISAVTHTVTGSTVTWTWTTNEPADSDVEFGAAAWWDDIGRQPALVTQHSSSFNYLKVGTTYTYQVMSRDAAGNLAISPRYTFSVGSTDSTPPVISNVAAAPAGSSATVTWATNEASDSQVEYGATTAYGQATAVNTTPVTAHNAALGGLTSGATYHYRVKSRDAAGNLAASPDYTFVTTDSTPPVISALQTSSITATSATITWSTNEAADSQIEYGITTAYGQSTAVDTTKVTAHSAALSGLTSGATYHYRVKSRDAAGNLAVSGNATFTSGDNVAPVISAVQAGSLTGTSASVTWTTNEASDSQVEYGTTTAYGQSTALNTTKVTAHSAALSGLTTGATHHYRVKSRDAAGNLAVSGDYTFVTNDTTPPVISAVQAGSIAATSATITWSTNEASDTQVEYGNTMSLGQVTSLNTAAVTAHSGVLTGLTGGTTCFYRAKSRDAAGNLAVSPTYSFATTNGADTTPPVISAVTHVLNGTTVTWKWNTNEPADTDVEIGIAGQWDDVGVQPALVTVHSLSLINRTPGVTYSYRVLSRDAAGNRAVSPDYGFTVPSGVDTTAPIISNLVVTPGVSMAIITWTTNEPATTRVDYGPATASDYDYDLYDAALVTFHQVTLSGLSSGQYRFKVRSWDAAGNGAGSAHLLFNVP